MAPPKCHASTGSRLGILNIHWGFRKIFKMKVREAMEQHTRERKEVHRVRRDSLSGQPKKKTKLDLEPRGRSHTSEDGRASTSSKSSKRSGASKTKKTLQVRIGKRSQTLVSQKNPSPCKTGRRRRESTSSSAPSDRSGRQSTLSTQGEVRVTVPSAQGILFVGDDHPHFTSRGQGGLPSASVTRHTGRGGLSAPASCLARGRVLLGNQGLAPFSYSHLQCFLGLRCSTVLTRLGRCGGTAIL